MSMASVPRLVVAWMLWCCAVVSHAAPEFLDPVDAFRLSVRTLDDRTLGVRFDIAPGYYLYRDSLSVAATDTTVKLDPLQVPPGTVKYDPNFEKNVEIYHDKLELKVPVGQAGRVLDLTVRSQGCAEKGVCYPPSERMVQVGLTGFGGDGAARVVDVADAAAPGWLGEGPSPGAGEGDALDEGGVIYRALSSGRWLVIVGAFFVAGLLLSLTPCVLPMVPILSSIVVGHRRQGADAQARARGGLWLAVSYSLGMAMIYTGLGIVAGLAGEGLAAYLQKPWVLGLFSALLVVLSLSMFGVYELQVPAWIHERLHRRSQALPGGDWLGVFLMGGLSALIVSPCVAAPLAGALLYISQTRDVLMGGIGLFAMAVGMSVPLLLLGASAEAWVPKAGAWMTHVKAFFGFVLIGVALWTLQPALPSATWAMVLWGALAVAVAVFFWRITSAGAWRPMLRVVALSCAAVGMLQWGGVATGGRDVLAPWTGWTQGPQEHGLAFQRVRSVAELDTFLAQGSQPVMLDFYADWCVSCKEMERFTFSDEQVRKRLANVLLLQVDVTENNDEDRALLRRFRLFGPPGIMFFDAAGQERGRVIGFQDARQFKQSLRAAGL